MSYNLRMQRYLMTRKTKERLEKDIAQLEKDVTRLRKEIGVAYRLAPGDGWHDNAALEAVDESLQIAEIRLRELKLRVRLAQIVEARKVVRDVGIGNEVRVEYVDEGREQVWTILGEEDSGTSEDWISHTSPVAQMLLGKKVGQVVDLGWVKVRIVAIAPGNFD